MIAAVNRAAASGGTVINAAGSMPGDLHKLWRSVNHDDYHVEYGYSCMGYEIPGGLGVKLADPLRHVFVLVGDGSYLMMNSEIVTAHPGARAADDHPARLEGLRLDQLPG